MILLLVITQSNWLEKLLEKLPHPIARAILPVIRSQPPAALGKVFEQD